VLPFGGKTHIFTLAVNYWVDIMDKVKTYSAKVEEVHSADDYILLVNLGVDGLFKRVRARLAGVDAPNAYKAVADTEAGIVRDECKKILGGRCFVEVLSEGKGGWAVRMYTNEQGVTPVCINDVLISRGYIYQRGVQA
jgi:hypothetical protein